MFYSQDILARKGPLGKIWLAAHFDKKLTRAQIFATSIEMSVQSVLNPAAPLALRVSGHLMLGIVRIYSRKVKYLISDCTEAMWKIKLAFKSGNVDLDSNLISNINIDDAKYFGNFSDDTEFPELEGTAFPPFLLTGYDSRIVPATTRKYSSIEGDELVDETSFRFNVMNVSAGDRSPAVSRGSRVSDIELVRDQSRISLGIKRASTSLSSRPALAEFITQYDDEIPAFDNPEEEPIIINWQSSSTPLDENLISFDKPSNEYPDYTFQDDAEPMENSQVISNLNIRSDQVISGDHAVQHKPKTKRTQIEFDDKVELTNRIIKQRIENLDPIIRRYPTDEIIFASTKYMQPLELQIFRPTHMHGFCSELDKVLSIISNHAQPFPIKLSVQSEDLQNNGIGGDTNIGDENINFEQVRDENINFAGRDSTASTGEAFNLQTGYDVTNQELINETQYPDVDYGQYEPEPLFQDNLAIEMEPIKKKAESRSRFDLMLGVEEYKFDNAGLKSSLSQKLTNVIERNYYLEESFNKKTEEIRSLLNDELDATGNEHISFFDLTIGVTKAVAATAFLEVLHLKSMGNLTLSQSSPFADIAVSMS
eukprot:gene4624-6503_t